MSETFTLHPILGCLHEAEKFIGCDEWKPINDAQERFIETCLVDGFEDLLKFEDGELKCKSAKNIEEINKWLAENGFPDLQLKPNDKPTAFAVASILHVFLNWQKKGKETAILYDDKRYPAAHIDYESIKFFTIKDHDNVIAYIPTKRKGEYVLMTVYPGIKDSLHWIMDVNNQIIDGRLSHDYRFKGLTFPQIDYDEMIDISFIQGMKNPGTNPNLPPWFIVEAIQQTRFKMNHIGAEVESAVAMTMVRAFSASSLPPLVINQPFLMGIFRKELEFPYFLGHFTPENWKEVNIDFEENTIR